MHACLGVGGAYGWEGDFEMIPLKSHCPLHVVGANWKRIVSTESLTKMSHPVGVGRERDKAKKS